MQVRHILKGPVNEFSTPLTGKMSPFNKTGTHQSNNFKALTLPKVSASENISQTQYCSYNTRSSSRRFGT